MPFETALAQAQVAGYETPLLAIALARGKLPSSLEPLDKGTGGALARAAYSALLAAAQELQEQGTSRYAELGAPRDALQSAFAST